VSNIEPTRESRIYKIRVVTEYCFILLREQNGSPSKFHEIARPTSAICQKYRAVATARGLMRKKNRILCFDWKVRTYMSAARNYLAGIWGAAAFYSLCYGIFRRSTDALLLFAALAPSLLVFVLWIIDCAALERRIKRLEARSEIADERRVIAQTDLSEFEHKLEEVETRIACAEKLQGPGG
jgi:hypothetical protein